MRLRQFAPETDTSIRVEFPYADDVRLAVKALGGTFVPKETTDLGYAYWSLPLHVGPAALAFAKRFAFHVPPDLQLYLQHPPAPPPVRRAGPPARSDAPVQAPLWSAPPAPAPVPAAVSSALQRPLPVQTPAVTPQRPAAARAAAPAPVSAKPRTARTPKLPPMPTLRFGNGRKLRPFQELSVQRALAVQPGKGFLLADDMGLGKTAQAIAILAAKNAFPAVIICPASLKTNWARELATWLPGRTSRILSGTTSTREERHRPHPDVWIINYDILAPRIDAHQLPFNPHDLRAVVADEAHYVSNPESKRTRAVGKFCAVVPFQLMLSGTPIVNRPYDLVSLLTMMHHMEDVFGSTTAFIDRYCEPKWNGFAWEYRGATHLDELHQKLVGSCMLRRTKGEVLHELPEKERTVIDIDLSERERGAYTTKERRLETAAENMITSRNTAFARISGLAATEQPAARESYANRELAADRAALLGMIMEMRKFVGERKLPMIIDWVKTFRASGEKLLLFAEHVAIQDTLIATFPGCASLQSKDSPAVRQANIDRFQTDPDCHLFVSSLGAGGVGITLTAASHVAFAEMGWTAAEMTQAEDRVHRIGQTKHVQVYYFLSRGTIDDQLFALTAKKHLMAQAAIDGVPMADAATASESTFTSVLRAYTERTAARQIVSPKSVPTPRPAAAAFVAQPPRPLIAVRATGSVDPPVPQSSRTTARPRKGNHT